MKTFRTALMTLAALALSWVFQQPARADVRSLRPTQTLPRPASPAWQYFGIAVAIDGPHIIVLAANDGTSGSTYAALLYRRNNSDGRWVYRRTLVTANGLFVRMDVRMRNGIAAVNFGGQVSLFEYSGGDYVPARTAAPIHHPGGLAISGDSVLIGGNDCDYDAVIYQKGADANWGITGRLDDNAGECATEGLEVELNYGYALLRPRYGTVTAAWRRNGTALDWIPAGVLALPPGEGISAWPYTLQGATAVGNNGFVYRRSGTSDWILQGKATSVDIDNSFGITHGAVNRDGVLATTESGLDAPFARLYLEASPGRFEHVASLKAASAYDVSGRTVAAATADYRGDTVVEVFTLPNELRAPEPIVNDFEDREISDIDALSGQFQLAMRGSNDVLAQNNPNGLSIALVGESDWTDYQRVEANIAQTAGGADSWVGLVARYVDANNYYFAAIHPNRTYGVYKRVNGVDTLLQGGTYYTPLPTRAVLAVDGDQLSLKLGFEPFEIGTDRSLPRGRAGLATWQARADFDDVQAAATAEYGLLDRSWNRDGRSYEVDLTTAGGNWQVTWHELEDPLDTSYPLYLQQFDMSGDARAYTGTPVKNVDMTAHVRLDAFGASPQNAWFGVTARYVDPSNFYYVTVRSSGQIQIRKVVNGVITVLASANFTPVPLQYYDLRFRVINDQLQVFVDRTLLASAHDDDIERGRYGLATYRTAATWESFSVMQP